MATNRIAVVTGGNKGIGLEICRQLASNGVTVVLTARDEKRGVEAVKSLQASGFSHVVFRQLDVTDPASVASSASFIKTQFGKFDILVNNAGVLNGVISDSEGGYNDVVGDKAKFKQSYKMAEACLRTNYYGVKLVTQELIPLLELSDSPRIVNVSSTMGQLQLIPNKRATKELSNVESLTEERVDAVVKEFLEDVKEGLVESKGWPSSYTAYTVSKAALNAYTRVLAKMHPKISINAVCPGYVKTDLTNNQGILSAAEGAKAAVSLALMPNSGPSGLFYSRMKVSTL